ncbi:MAG TPA: 2-oxoglutarate dehydrogenase complex dihydrolipoyllysine-residue succinyltransferase [Gammaproteobacteria bacterium]
MNIEVKVPQLPESVADATLIAWHRKAGEAVRRDENLVDLETDKVVLEVPAPADGILVDIRKADGATVTSGEVLAVLQPGAVAGDRAQTKPVAAPAPKSAPASGGEAKPRAAEPATRPATPEGSLKAGPAVRNLIEEHALDPASIRGTGREGRITKTDVIDHLAEMRNEPAAAASVPSPRPAVAETPVPATRAGRAERRVAMTRLRQRVAERLVEAQATAAMLTTFNEVDMSAVVDLRKRYQEQFQARYTIKLGFMSFFVRAAIEALREFPQLNASIDGKEVVYHEYFDIGVAVATDRGLLVPVLRDAQDMSFAEIEKRIHDLGQRAQSGEISMEELTGGTFTITNGGVFGSLMSTPILNPPQSGILGMHKIQERPVVVDGAIAIRPMMYLALTYDHRLIDGREAVQFLVHIKEQLEDPARLALQI